MNENVKNSKTGVSSLFEIDGKSYRRKQFFYNDIINRIVSDYGVPSRTLTYEQLGFIAQALIDGWELIPGFYGTKSECGTIINPNFSWFSFIGLAKDSDNKYSIPHQYMMCVNYQSSDITLYDFEHLIGTFPCYYDMNECTNWRTMSMLPAKISVKNSANVIDNVMGFFDQSCTFDDIYTPNSKVFEQQFSNVFYELKPDFDKLTVVEDNY